MKTEHRDLALYIAKCMVGTVLMVAVGDVVPLLDISWILISMVLVLSPDGAEALPLTIVRVKSNVAASIASVVFLLLFSNITLAVCLAMMVTILVCYHFNLMAGSRAALAAILIISLHPQGAHLWSTAAIRVVSVAAGCGLGLLLTFLFHHDLVAKVASGADKHVSE